MRHGQANLLPHRKLKNNNKRGTDMPRKRDVSTADFTEIIRHMMEMSAMPTPEIDFDNLDDMVFEPSRLSELLASVLSKKPAPDAEMLPVSGTRSVCIRIPARVIRFYKLKAAATGTCYQTLMNRALAAATKTQV